MEGYPNWADTGCGCLTTTILSVGLLAVVGFNLMRGLLGF